ncbi:MAG TPA: hypothetical protein VLV86_09135 [Vicinamibacterales bacterium]|nr:hypothetical protein [Vicinamibacterales bacterium]
MTKNQGPTEAQLQAAIEGAKDMPQAARAPGRVAVPAESRVNPADQTEQVDPEEAVKRETAVFLPGTHGKKAQP